MDPTAHNEEIPFVRPPLRHFRMLARYNALANRRLYEACARLGDAERKKERPAFFGSPPEKALPPPADKKMERSRNGARGGARA